MTRIDPLSSERPDRSRGIAPSQSGYPDPEAGVRASKRLRNSTQTDQVNVSPNGKLASKVHNVIRETPDVREGLVAEIKAAVDNGTYQLDPREIAEAMLKPSSLKRVEGR